MLDPIVIEDSKLIAKERVRCREGASCSVQDMWRQRCTPCMGCRCMLHASAVVVHCVHGAQQEPPAVGFWHTQRRTTSMSQPTWLHLRESKAHSHRQGYMLTCLAGVMSQGWSRLRGTCPESKLGAQLCLQQHWGSPHVLTYTTFYSRRSGYWQLTTPP